MPAPLADREPELGYEPNWDPDRASTFEVGVDAIEIERIRAAVERFGGRFLERISPPRERERYGRRPAELAARFAAKEAVMKALGTGVRGIRWRDIEVMPNARGRPIVILHDTARERARRIGLTSFAISLTHSQTEAIAMVVASSFPAAASPGRDR
jgi:holo-[acyl-carrier protein] synthase